MSSVQQVERGGVIALVDAVVNELRLTSALRLAEQLRLAASRSPAAAAAARRLAELIHHGDGLSAIAALHALAAVDAPLADEVLLEVARGGEPPFDGHAAWALSARRASLPAIETLVRLVGAGGFTSMLAERTLIEWSRSAALSIVGAALAAIADQDLAGRQRMEGLLRSLGPELVPEAEWLVSDLEFIDRSGIVVIQPFLHARLDGAGTTLGAGDSGGIASLLRTLGGSLGDVSGIGQVITVTRRHDGEEQAEQLTPGHRVQRVDVGPPGALPWREGWIHRVQIERQLVALGAALAGRDVVWHLRMADVGTLAAAGAARRLGHRVVFTAAPDPHVVIDALQDSGRLDRSKFALEDAAAQYWFRARMVERLAGGADRLVLLPRPTIEQELTDLVGIEPAELRARSVVIPEGVDIGESDRAQERYRATGISTEVRQILDSLPRERRALPWIVTVGRLNPTKGAHRIVEAVATDPALAARVNIVVVGGDLLAPSPDEQSTIERIRLAATGADPGLVTLAGHHPPRVISDILAHVAATGGVYVSASDKEEFGLAIVEALAAGAVVVAPQRGGPGTYIVDGDTGVLCDTLRISAVRWSILDALGLTDVPGRAERARALVRQDLSIDQMAERLGELYRVVHPAPVPA